MKKEENKLTERQTDTLIFIMNFILKNGFSPSLNEVAKGIFVSKPVAQRHITALITKGYLKHTPNTNRSYVIKKVI